jgi:hypothetical protein
MICPPAIEEICGGAKINGDSQKGEPKFPDNFSAV